MFSSFCLNKFALFNRVANREFLRILAILFTISFSVFCNNVSALETNLLPLTQSDGTVESNNVSSDIKENEVLPSVPSSKLDFSSYEPASNGLTVADIEKEIANLVAKGDSLSAEEKNNLSAYQQTLEIAKKSFDNFRLLQIIDDTLQTKDQVELEEIKTQIEDFITDKVIESTNDINELTRYQSLYNSLKNNALHKTGEIDNYIKKINALPVLSQSNAATNTDKIIANKNLLLGLTSETITEVDVLKISAENLFLESENNLKKYILDSSTLLLEILNQKLELYKQLISKCENIEKLIAKRIQFLRKEKTLNEHKKALDKNLQINSDHRIITILLDEYKQTLTDLENSFEKINEYNKINRKLEKLIARTEAIESDLSRQLDFFDDTIYLSQVLFNQQKFIPTFDLPINLNERISDVRIALYNTNLEKDAHENVDLYIESLLIKYGITSSLDAQTQKELKQIIKAHKEVLTELANQMLVELNNAVLVQINYAKYLKLKENLNDQIYEQMFWSPSSHVMNLKWFSAFQENFKKEINFIKQTTSNVYFKSPEVLNLIIGSVVLILSFILMLIQPKLDLVLNSLNSCVGRFSKDTHLVTVKALGVLMLKSLKIPLFLTGLVIIFAGFLYTKSSAQDFVNVGFLPILKCLKWLSILLLSLFFLNIIKPLSILEKHFGKVVKDKQYKNQRRIFTYVLLIELIVIIKLFKTDDFMFDVIGQSILFITLIVLLIEFIISFREKIKKHSSLWSKIVSISMATVILLVIGLVYFGYYYSAVCISDLLVISYMIMLSYSIVFDTVMRSFSLAARRLNFKRILEIRAARKEAKTEESNVEAEIIESTEEEMPISEINSQTRQILRYLLISVFAAFIYGIWSDVIQVISYFQTFNLYSITSADNLVVSTITLLDVLVVLYVFLITIIVIKNLPGVLEVLIFNRFENIQKYSYSILTITNYILIAVSILISASKLGLSWDKLQWLVAALSVGLGFGLQEIFANFVSGLIILFERPVRIGDVITINGHNGVVSRIRIRATTITDFDRKDYVVPNKLFITTPLINWSLNDSITRLVVGVQAGYGSDVQQVKDVLKMIADRNPYVVKDPKASIYFISFGDSNLNFELRVYVTKTSDRNLCLDLLNTEIYNEFNKLGIEIAFNQLDVYVKNLKTNEEIKIAHEDKIEIKGQ